MPKLNINNMSADALLDLREQVDNALMEKRRELERQNSVLASNGGERVVGKPSQ